MLKEQFPQHPQICSNYLGSPKSVTKRSWKWRRQKAAGLSAQHQQNMPQFFHPKLSPVFRGTPPAPPSLGLTLGARLPVPKALQESTLRSGLG